MKESGKMFPISIIKDINILYNILYKLHIYELYRLNDCSVQYLVCPFDYPIIITTDLLRCIINCHIERVTYVDLEYYYKKEKNGSKKIVYTKKHKVHEVLFLAFNVRECDIKYSDSFYNKRHLVINTLNPIDPIKPSDAPLFTQKTYSVEKVLNLRQKFLLCETEDSAEMDKKKSTLDKDEIEYYHRQAKNQFTRCLNDITLKDLEV